MKHLFTLAAALLAASAAFNAIERSASAVEPVAQSANAEWTTMGLDWFAFSPGNWTGDKGRGGNVYPQVLRLLPEEGAAVSARHQ